jgi:hypothetical protein
MIFGGQPTQGVALGYYAQPLQGKDFHHTVNRNFCNHHFQQCKKHDCSLKSGL